MAAPTPRGRSLPATPTPPRAEQPREALLRGEVVETACFVMAGRRGEPHKQCAIACASAGQRLAILDEASGLLYLTLSDHTSKPPVDPLREHIAQKVEVKGLLVERGGMRAVFVRSVRSLGESVPEAP